MLDTSMYFNLDTKNLDFAIDAFREKFAAGLAMYSETAARKLEAKAKMNRPWTDRTGEAKRRLTGTSEMEGQDKCRIVLAHGVEYGIWLEIAHEQNFAILEPTVRQNADEIMQGLNNFVTKVNQGA